MLVVLKIPLVYLGLVIWWAVRAQPAPEDGPEAAGVLAPLAPCGWDEEKSRRRSARLARRPFRPTGRPARRAHAVATA